ERVCEWHGYDVISASERRKRHDLREIPDVTVTSQAQVRCKDSDPIFGGRPAPQAPAPAPPPRPPSSAPPAPPPADAPEVPPAEPAPPGAGTPRSQKDF